ncbi:hypothetical protein Tco_1341417, partial [Tanacetum coccineum]
GIAMVSLGWGEMGVMVFGLVLQLEVLEDWEAKFEEKYVKVSQLGSEKASTTVVDEKLQGDQTKEE